MICIRCTRPLTARLRLPEGFVCPRCFRGVLHGEPLHIDRPEVADESIPVELVRT